MVSEHFRVLGSRACPLLVNAMLDPNDLGFAMRDVENSMLMSWLINSMEPNNGAFILIHS